jgi:ethanolamine utilization microcompartment shell protein EutL
MDQRIESFLGDVLALAGEEPDAVREGVRVALAKCEAIFRLQETKNRMRDQAAHACRALCRARVAEELQRRRGTGIGEHLKLVLSIIRPAGTVR